jgi:gas vesicle protein
MGTAFQEEIFVICPRSTCTSLHDIYFGHKSILGENAENLFGVKNVHKRIARWFLELNPGLQTRIPYHIYPYQIKKMSKEEQDAVKDTLNSVKDRLDTMEDTFKAEHGDLEAVINKARECAHALKQALGPSNAGVVQKDQLKEVARTVGRAKHLMDLLEEDWTSVKDAYESLHDVYMTAVRKRRERQEEEAEEAEEDNSVQKKKAKPE